MTFDPKNCDPKTISAASPLRTRLADETKTAMKAKDSERLSTLRLMSAKIKDQDILIREKGQCAIDDAQILSTLQTMIKQRRESISMFEKGGKQEAADKEQSEIKVIEEFLPKQLSGDALDNIIATTIEKSGADSPKDMGKVIGLLKADYAGQIDFGKASGIIKQRLAG